MSNAENAGIIFTVYMRREGRVTVPKELRDAYNLKEGDLVECSIRKIKWWCQIGSSYAGSIG